MIKQQLVFVDVEGKGAAAALNDSERFEWGAVHYNSWKAGEAKTFHCIGANRNSMMRFDAWVRSLGEGPYIFMTDNVAYDWQHLNYYFHLYLQRNPFGHSARRIGDFAAGLKAAQYLARYPVLESYGNEMAVLHSFVGKQTWKKLRVTKHTHHPVDDAMGNVEAFDRLLKGETG